MRTMVKSLSTKHLSRRHLTIQDEEGELTPLGSAPVSYWQHHQGEVDESPNGTRTMNTERGRLDLSALVESSLEKSFASQDADGESVSGVSIYSRRSLEESPLPSPIMRRQTSALEEESTREALDELSHQAGDELAEMVAPERVDSEIAEQSVSGERQEAVPDPIQEEEAYAVQSDEESTYNEVFDGGEIGQPENRNAEDPADDGLGLKRGISTASSAHSRDRVFSPIPDALDVDYLDEVMNKHAKQTQQENDEIEAKSSIRASTASTGVGTLTQGLDRTTTPRNLTTAGSLASQARELHEGMQQQEELQYEDFPWSPGVTDWAGGIPRRRLVDVPTGDSFVMPRTPTPPPERPAPPRSLIGKRVHKEFPGFGCFQGHIRGWDKVKQTYMVEFPTVKRVAKKFFNWRQRLSREEVDQILEGNYSQAQRKAGPWSKSKNPKFVDVQFLATNWWASLFGQFDHVVRDMKANVKPPPKPLTPNRVQVNQRERHAFERAVAKPHQQVFQFAMDEHCSVEHVPEPPKPVGPLCKPQRRYEEMISTLKSRVESTLPLRERIGAGVRRRTSLSIVGQQEDVAPDPTEVADNTEDAENVESGAVSQRVGFREPLVTVVEAEGDEDEKPESEQEIRRARSADPQSHIVPPNAPTERRLSDSHTLTESEIMSQDQLLDQLPSHEYFGREPDADVASNDDDTEREERLSLRGDPGSPRESISGDFNGPFDSDQVNETESDVGQVDEAADDAPDIAVRQDDAVESEANLANNVEEPLEEAQVESELREDQKQTEEVGSVDRGVDHVEVTEHVQEARPAEEEVAEEGNSVEVGEGSQQEESVHAREEYVGWYELGGFGQEEPQNWSAPMEEAAEPTERSNDGVDDEAENDGKESPPTAGETPEGGTASPRTRRLRLTTETVLSPRTPMPPLAGRPKPWTQSNLQWKDAHRVEHLVLSRTVKASRLKISQIERWRIQRDGESPRNRPSATEPLRRDPVAEASNNGASLSVLSPRDRQAVFQPPPLEFEDHGVQTTLHDLTLPDQSYQNQLARRYLQTAAANGPSLGRNPRIPKEDVERHVRNNVVVTAPTDLRQKRLDGEEKDEFVLSGREAHLESFFPSLPSTFPSVPCTFPSLPSTRSNEDSLSGLPSMPSTRQSSMLNTPRKNARRGSILESSFGTTPMFSSDTHRREQIELTEEDIASALKASTPKAAGHKQLLRRRSLCVRQKLPERLGRAPTFQGVFYNGEELDDELDPYVELPYWILPYRNRVYLSWMKKSDRKFWPKLGEKRSEGASKG